MKTLKLKQLTLNEIVNVYKICKPYLAGEFEPYLVAKSIYTVSKDKAKKLLNLLYSNVRELDDVSMCITIAKGMQENSCGQFFTYLSEAKNGK